jgi:hypothetical protein
MEVDMNARTPYPDTRQQRRARAVYGTMKRRPMVGLVAAELGVLALLTLVVAGIIGVRAWLALAG